MSLEQSCQLDHCYMSVQRRPFHLLICLSWCYNLTFSGQSPVIKLLRQIMILRSLPYICQFWQLIQYSHDAMMTFNTFQELAHITTWLSPIKTQQLNSQGKLKLTDLLSHLSVDRMTMLWDDHMAAEIMWHCHLTFSSIGTVIKTLEKQFKSRDPFSSVSLGSWDNDLVVRWSHDIITWLSTV